MSEREDDPVFAEQARLIKQHFEPVLMEPIPARMHLRQPAWIGFTRVGIVFTAGLALGLATHLLREAPPPAQAASTQVQALAVRAARAHAIYASEVRHPVEVEAAQQEHLVKWLSKRLGLDLKVPVLATDGFELLGGRLLPGQDGPVAQFMYQDGAGKRLTLYVSRPNRADAVTAFRFAQEGPVSVFYWIDNDCGYALSGEIDRPTLTRVATQVYQQLEH